MPGRTRFAWTDVTFARGVSILCALSLFVAH
jgi:hypothetical protein